MYAGAAARTVEGRLCSLTQAVRVGNWSNAFGSLCNQSFLVYLNLSSAGTGGLGVLIGSSARGWRDGFRTQALFEIELRVDRTGALFVLDRCLFSPLGTPESTLMSVFSCCWRWWCVPTKRCEDAPGSCRLESVES
jgi:hypothetical protein